MIGLLLKDIYNSGRQLKIYMVYPFVATFLAYQAQNVSMVCITLSILTMLIILSACAYDEQANFDAYALTLPLTRKDLVVSKYVLTLLVLLVNAGITSMASGFLSLVFHDHFTSINWQEIALTLLLLSAIMNILICILLPLIFKFGTEKARILLMVIFLSVGVLIYFISSLDMNIVNLDFIVNWGLYMLLAAAIIIEGISIVTSTYIYTKKEF